MKITSEQFISKARVVHLNKYDYSETVYLGSLSKVNIKCPIHGVFSQTAREHSRGKGCFKCGKQLRIESYKEFVKTKREDFSHIIVPDGAKAIPLTKGKYALVDEEDYERVMQYNWHVVDRYGVTKINGKSIGMHRFVMGITDPKILVDHKFHNTFDNRKSQLRVCSTSQNGINSEPQKGRSSHFKGVSWNKTNKKWTANLMCESTKYRLGYFTKEKEAAIAYDTKAKELFGEFAYLNFK